MKERKENGELNRKASLEKLRLWLDDNSQDHKDTETCVSHIEGFYSSYVVGVFHRPISMRIDGETDDDGHKRVLLNVIWPPEFSASKRLKATYTRFLRTGLKNYLATREVVSDIEVHLSIIESTDAPDFLNGKAPVLTSHPQALYLGLLDLTSVQN